MDNKCKLDATLCETIRKLVSQGDELDSVYEFHGMVCGLLCVNTNSTEEHVLKWLKTSSNQDFKTEEKEAFALFIDASAALLNDVHFIFELLLPEASKPLVERVIALSEWCHGFLFGFASISKREGHQLNQESRELLHDLSEISRAGLELGSTEAASEDSLIEIIEYVRLAVISLFLDNSITGQPK